MKQRPLEEREGPQGEEGALERMEGGVPASWGLPPDLSLHWVSPFIYQWRDSGYVLFPFGPQCAQLYSGDVRALSWLLQDSVSDATKPLTEPGICHS